MLQIALILASAAFLSLSMGYIVPLYACPEIVTFLPQQMKG